MIVPALIVILVTVFYVWYRQEYWKYNKKLEGYPGPTSYFWGSPVTLCSQDQILPELLKYYKQCKGSFVVRLGPIRPVVFVVDLKLTEFLLTSNKFIEKSADYRFLNKWLKNGLLTSTGSYWKRHRKIITPAFHFSILERFVDVYYAQALKLVEKLKQEIGKLSFDVHPYITLCTLDIISETSMGVSINAQDNSESKYVKAVKQMCDLVILRSFSPLKMYDVFYQFTDLYRKEKKALEVLHGYTQKVINKRKQELLAKKMDKHVVDEFGVKKTRFAFLDLLLQGDDGKQVLPDDEIQEEVDTLLFEGHDTTTSAIMFTLYLLSVNIEAQQNALNELEEIFKDDFYRALNYKDLQSMTYLEMVIKETLRLYPSVPFFGRNLQEDLEFDGRVFPKGCTLTPIPFLIHRDPQIYPEPEKFDPSRFADSSGRPPFSYLPFSAGARNCIGQKFAMLELKSVISTLLRYYEVLPAIPEHKVAVSAETVLKSANGICIRLKERLLPQTT